MPVLRGVAGADTFDAMKLFTPVSEDEAEALVEGRRLDGPLWWVDRVVVDEAAPDAVWVEAEALDAEVAAFDTTPDADIGYRQFEVPADFAARLTVVIVDR